MKPTVLLDVDGVVADCSTAMHRFAESVLYRPLPAPPWSNYDCDKAMGMSQVEAARFWDHARSRDWAHAIDLYPEAIDGVRRLMEVADVAFCTSPWKGNIAWCHHRQELLHKYFPGVDVIQTNAKQRVFGDFLVDDKVEQIEKDARWHGLLWTHPYNAAVEAPMELTHRFGLAPKWRRVHGWDDVIREVMR